MLKLELSYPTLPIDMRLHVTIEADDGTVLHEEMLSAKGGEWEATKGIHLHDPKTDEFISAYTVRTDAHIPPKA